MVIRGRAITAIKKEQRQKKMKHYGIVMCLLAFDALAFVGILALTLHLPVFRINNVVVQGVDGERLAQVTGEVDNLLKEKVAYIFPRYATILPLRTMVASLEEAVPWIESTGVTIGPDHTIKVSVREREPVYLVCSAPGICYYADVNTLVFAPAPDFSATVYPEIKIGTVPHGGIMSSNIFSSTEADKFEILLRSLAEQKIIASLIEKGSDGSVRIYAKEGWYLRLTESESAQDATASLKAVMKSDGFSSRYAKNPGNLEYVDVRLVDKVYYKFKDGGSHATATTSDN